MTRKRKWKLVAAVCLLLALAAAPRLISYLRWPSEGEFKGVFTYEFEVMDFQPDMSAENWWFDAKPDVLLPLRELAEEQNEPFVDNAPRFRVRVYGSLSPIGRHGHFGQWRRRLTVHELIEFQLISDE